MSDWEKITILKRQNKLSRKRQVKKDCVAVPFRNTDHEEVKAGN